VIHRDLKPANVRLTPDGRVKLLDFGLAKSAVENQESSSTDSVLSTEAGRLLGTPTYMAPEQARGKSIDKRVDVWAFGCVLYECLTAKRAFAGDTLTDVFAAVLEREPDWTKLPAATPSRVRGLLESCFAKDPRRRLRDIGQARLELEHAASESPVNERPVARPRPFWSSPAVLASACLLTAAIAVAAVGWRSAPGEPPSERAIVRATLAFPKDLVMPTTDRSVAVSPDGTQVVVVLRARGSAAPPALYLRDLSRLEFRLLAGTEEATYPFWSPDGESIAFFAARELRRIDLADGIVRVICKAPAGRGGAWGSQRTIVFAPSAVGGLSSVDDSGGAPTPLTEPAAAGESHRVPQMLPDGRRFLYYSMNAAKSGVYAFDPARKQARLVVESEAEAVFVEPSALVFARDGNLVVQSFDSERLELTGSPKPIAAGVYWSGPRAALNMGIASSGTLVYQPVARASTYRLAWLDLEGEQTPLSVEPFAFGGGSLSADGRRAAVNVAGNRGESWLGVLDLERGVRTSIGDPNARFYFGAFCSRDGQSVVTSDASAGGQSLVSFELGGGAPKRLLVGEPTFEYAVTSSTPDGRTLLLTKVPLRDKVGDVMTLDLEGDHVPKPFVATPEAEWQPLISPSGDFVAYAVSNEDDVGAWIKLVTYPLPSAPVQVSATRVSPNFGWLSAEELYWLDLSRRTWRATVSAKSGELDVGVPAPMFGGQPLDKDTNIVAYDLPRQRFLVTIEDSVQEDPQLIIVSDWRQDAATALAARK
jgi:Tol biopolymer transport system component